MTAQAGDKGERAVKSSSLESLVRHDFRLDILCCLVQESLTATQICARTGKPQTAVVFHIKLLGMGGLVSKQGDGVDALYTATLGDHPTWVAEAVIEHSQSD